jgi:TM2 domain-containing membrane protein YozV
MSNHSVESDRKAHHRELIEDTVFNARRSGLIAYLLWTFLGGLGMHNFYLGRPRAGGLQMAGTLLVYCTYVSDDPWPLIGLGVGILLGISLFIDCIRIPTYVVAYSERLRMRLTESIGN